MARNEHSETVAIEWNVDKKVGSDWSYVHVYMLHVGISLQNGSGLNRLPMTI